MIEYEGFAKGYRRSATMEESKAHRILGSRLMAGWQAVQVFVETPTGGSVSATWMLSAGDGRVWCLFVSEEW